MTGETDEAERVQNPREFKLDTGRRSEKRVLTFLCVVVLLVALYAFFYGLWKIHQPGAACDMPFNVVRIYTYLHLYNGQFVCG